MFGDSTARYQRLNAVIAFPAPEPAIVVNVSDPNNRSFFYLVRREYVTPLPYRGRLSLDPHDGSREYRLLPVRPAMRDTVAAFLERELGAVSLPRGSAAGSDSLRVGDRTVYVMLSYDQVSVWMDRGTDTRLVAEIAKRFDAALRTGEYDECSCREAGFRIRDS
jgi:hypothetical protein